MLRKKVYLIVVLYYYLILIYYAQCISFIFIPISHVFIFCWYHLIRKLTICFILWYIKQYILIKKTGSYLEIK